MDSILSLNYFYPWQTEESSRILSFQVNFFILGFMVTSSIRRFDFYSVNAVWRIEFRSFSRGVSFFLAIGKFQDNFSTSQVYFVPRLPIFCAWYTVKMEWYWLMWIIVKRGWNTMNFISFKQYYEWIFTRDSWGKGKDLKILNILNAMIFSLR